MRASRVAAFLHTTPTDAPSHLDNPTQPRCGTLSRAMGCARGGKRGMKGAGDGSGLVRRDL